MGWRRIVGVLALGAITAFVSHPAYAQTGAGRALARPSDEAAPAPAAPPSTSRPAPAPGPTAVPRPPPESYGGPRWEPPPEPPGPREPRGDRTQKHIGNVLWVIGAAAFVNSYFTFAFAGLVTGDAWLAVPVLGCFGYIADTSGAEDEPLFWVGGFAQLVSAALLATGIGLVATFEEEAPDPEAPSLSLVPFGDPRGAGLAAVGRF